MTQAVGAYCHSGCCKLLQLGSRHQTKMVLRFERVRQIVIQCPLYAKVVVRCVQEAPAAFCINL
jgi:hypothetical protein